MEAAIKLFVGEREYNVRVSRIILNFPNSYLADLFKSNIQQDQNVKQFFIDRDGDLFKYILAYLRDKDGWLCPNDIKIQSLLFREAEFFRLPDLTDLIHRNMKEPDLRTSILILGNIYRQILPV
jgi:hypothetical protein